MAWTTDEGSPISPGQFLHTSLHAVAMAAVCDCSFELIDHPPYSPDLAPSIFGFPTWNKHLAGKQYQIDDEVISAVEDYFKDLDERFNSQPINFSAHPHMYCSTEFWWFARQNIN